MIDLGTPTGTSQSAAIAINDDGLILVGAGTRGFLYIRGVFTDLGTLGGTTTYVSGINSRGQVVGTSTIADGTDHAFLYRDGTITDLNDYVAPGSGWVLEGAGAINDHGQIVGNGTLNGNFDAFLLTPVRRPAKR